jgi:hypothetical protein
VAKKLRGRIIRIVDAQTVVINLGSQAGIAHGSIFSILSDLEEIVDPQTGDKLGSIHIVKGRLQASQVFPRFTVATSSWTDYSSPIFGTLLGEQRGESLTVRQEDVQPWSAKTEQPVRVGDFVEVTLEDQPPKTKKRESGSPPRSTKSR